jgi:hypothetical protein
MITLSEVEVDTLKDLLEQASEEGVTGKTRVMLLAARQFIKNVEGRRVSTTTSDIGSILRDDIKNATGFKERNCAVQSLAMFLDAVKNTGKIDGQVSEDHRYKPDEEFAKECEDSAKAEDSGSEGLDKAISDIGKILEEQSAVYGWKMKPGKKAQTGGTCEKCGSNDFRMVWIGKETIMPNMAPAGREYKLRTCNACGYSWEEPYEDKKAETCETCRFWQRSSIMISGVCEKQSNGLGRTFTVESGSCGLYEKKDKPVRGDSEE